MLGFVVPGRDIRDSEDDPLLTAWNLDHGGQDPAVIGFNGEGAREELFFNQN